MFHKTRSLLFWALLASGIAASAQPGAPFFSYLVGGNAAPSNTPVSEGAKCFYFDGTVPSFSGGAPDGITSCLKAWAFNDVKTWNFENQIQMTATLEGNITGIAAQLNLNPVAWYNDGQAEVNYAQQVVAPPGSQISGITFFVSGGNAGATLGVSSDCPDPGGPDCGSYSAGAGGFIPPGTMGQMFSVAPITVGPSGLFVISAQVSTVYTAFEPPSYQPPFGAVLSFGCAALNGQMSIEPKPFGPSGVPGTEITGWAWPMGGLHLQDAAHNCGYEGFDWQQFITGLPCPNYFQTAVTSPQPLPSSNYCSTPTAPGLVAGTRPDGTTAPAFPDAPDGGYTYAIVAAPGDQFEPAGPYNPYPFYYPAGVAETPNFNLAQWTGDKPGEGIYPVNWYDQKLLFYDGPSDPLLPAGSAITFQTNLVGIQAGSPPSASPPLLAWQWQSTFNGTVGGISSLVTKDSTDPGSGTGNATITSFNGVSAPPIVPANQIATTASGLAYSRVSQTFNGTVTIKNVGTTTITTPTSFQLALAALPAGVFLANAVGVFNLTPYVTVPTITSLAPGQSATVPVQFYNPTDLTINFTPQLFAGTFQ